MDYLGNIGMLFILVAVALRVMMEDSMMTQRLFGRVDLHGIAAIAIVAVVLWVIGIAYLIS